MWLESIEQILAGDMEKCQNDLAKLGKSLFNEEKVPDELISSSKQTLTE